MKLFGKILGKASDPVAASVQKDADLVDSGIIDKLYPILKPGDWVGIQGGAVRKTLIGTPEKPELVIAFGYDAPSNFVFLMQDDLKRLDPALVEKQAYKNLEEYKVGFEMLDLKGAKLFTSSGDDFCSEKILLPSVMMGIQKVLRTEKLHVSIPRRRCLMAIADTGDREVISAFLAVHAELWNDDSEGNPPIINGIFIVKNGKMTNFIPR